MKVITNILDLLTRNLYLSSTDIRRSNLIYLISELEKKISIFFNYFNIGMLLMGVLLRNVPKINVGKDIDSNWSRTIR